MKLAMTQPQVALSAVCGVLAILFVYENSAPLPAPQPPEVHLHEKHSALAPPAQFLAPASATFAEIDNRPVFSPARKPIERAPPPNTQVAAPPPSVSLIGVIIDGKNNLALVKAPGAAFATSYSVGANISGWVLTEIKSDRIVLHAGTANDEIMLNSNPAPPQQSSGATQQQP